jgi:hypothetical protein
MEAYRYEPSDDNTTVLGLALLPEQAEQIGHDSAREFAFALASLDTNDPATLRWLAACAIQRSLDLQA